MTTTLRHHCWILLIASMVFFVNLGGPGLWDEDEALYASVAFEMMQRGDPVVPTFNDKLFAEKPPLSYWLMIVGYQFFGVTELAARFFSALFGIGAAILTYHLGRRLFDPRTGLWAGLVMATTVIFTVSARAATMDSIFVFLTTAAMLAFVTGGSARSGPEQGCDFKPVSWRSSALFYACLALALLTKGPIGLALPVSALLIFLLAKRLLRVDDGSRPEGGARFGEYPPPPERRGNAPAIPAFGASSGTLHEQAGAAATLLSAFRPTAVLRTAWQLRPLTGLLLISAIALPWYVLVEQRTEGAFLREFLGAQNLGRIGTAMQGHSGPFWYYVPAILVGFFPWSVFMAPTLIESVRGMARASALRTEHMFVACWIGVFVAAWSVPATKLPHYVLPAYPALALATGWFIDRWLARQESVHRDWMTAAAIVTALVGAGFAMLFPMVAARYAPGEESLRFLGLPLIAGALIFRLLTKRGRREAAMVSFAATATILQLSIFAVATARIDRFQEARPMIAALRTVEPGKCDLAGYRFGRESLVFYARQPIVTLARPHQLRAFLRESSRPFVFTSNEYEAELTTIVGEELEVLARRPLFLRPGEILLLGRRAPGSAASTRGD